MYRTLEQALRRIFGVPEPMMNNARWQRDINTGYRRTSANPVASTRDERLGEDGVYQGYLRQRMTPELHDILTIRYDDDHSKRVIAFQRLQHHFRTDERLPKPFRSNPVLLRLWLMHELQHPQLRQHKGRVTIKDKGESTVYRWQQKCRMVCCEWVRLAEDEAQALLEQAGVIQYGE
jgi:hypothetical protein